MTKKTLATFNVILSRTADNIITTFCLIFMQRIDVFPNMKDDKAIQSTQLSQFFICLLCFSIRQVYLFIYIIKLICNLLHFSMWLLLQERSQLQESPSKK